jgi:hypothetical protein
MTKGYGQGAEILIKRTGSTVSPRLKVVCVLLAILAAVFAVVAVLVVGYNNRVAGVRDVDIGSGQDFLDAMADKVLNDNYRLTTDIQLSAEQLEALPPRYLKGTFNGKGHTITIAGTMNQPLFDIIDSDAVVQKLRLKGIVAMSDGISLSLLANTNYGIVENCEVVDSEITVLTQKYVAGIVAHNFGTIQYCLTSVEIRGRNSVAGRTHIGGAVAVNYKGATVRGLLSSTSFAGSYPELQTAFFNDGETNDKIGYVVGLNNGELENSFAVDCAFLDTASDTSAGYIRAMESAAVNVDLIRYTLLWDTIIWTMPLRGGLPTLTRG